MDKEIEIEVERENVKEMERAYRNARETYIQANNRFLVAQDTPKEFVEFSQMMEAARRLRIYSRDLLQAKKSFARLTNPPKHQSILVAFSVAAETEKEGVEKISNILVDHYMVDENEIDCWWVAEDSSEADCDSAVFVKPGYQSEARTLLYHNHLAN
jgi:hypothetical protein